MIPLLNEKKLDEVIAQMAQSIALKHPQLSQLIFVGIQRRGVILAERLIEYYKTSVTPAQAGISSAATGSLIESGMIQQLPSLGTLDINLYRDDFSSLQKTPVVHATHIPVSIQDKGVILIDEVLFTGRTIRAAMGALFDLGRPAFVELAVLVDRGGRELPIHPNYVGLTHEVTRDQEICVKFKELDGENAVGVKNVL